MVLFVVCQKAAKSAINLDLSIYHFRCVPRTSADSTTVQNYADAYQNSIEEPEEFWAEVGAKMLHWDKPFEKVLDNSKPPFTKWYCGGYLNACYNAIDRHIATGKGDKVAIIHDSPMLNTVRRVTYQEMYDTVSKTARRHDGMTANAKRRCAREQHQHQLKFVVLKRCLFADLSIGRWPASPGRREGRPCGDLYAVDPRSGHGYAGHGAIGRCPFGCVRR